MVSETVTALHATTAPVPDAHGTEARVSRVSAPSRAAGRASADDPPTRPGRFYKLYVDLMTRPVPVRRRM